MVRDESDETVFIVTDKLPLVSELVICLLDGKHNRKMDSKIFLSRVQNMARQVHKIWNRIFPGNTVDVKTVNERIKKVFREYLNKVGRKKNHRDLLPVWRNENAVLMDIIKDKKLLNSRDAGFYNDQLSNRALFCSDFYKTDDVDEHNVRDDNEETTVDDDDDDTVQQNYENDLNVSVNNMSIDEDSDENSSTSDDDDDSMYKYVYLRSGVKRVRVGDPVLQIPEVKLRDNIKTFKEKVLRTVISLVSVAHCSVPQARLAFQLVSNLHFDQNYELCVDEKIEGGPRTSDDFEKYKNHIPSESVLYKRLHQMAMQREFECAQAMITAPPTTKITIGFDTTQRAHLKHEWVSFVVHFSDRTEKFRLRPLFLAYEDRDNTVNIFVEQIKRLSTLASVNPEEIWRKVYAIMTDSVRKMLEIEKLIAEKLESYHIPLHFLCVAHTAEGFERKLLEVVLKIEKELQLREKVLNSNPSLKRFLVGQKSITEQAMVAFSKLSNNDGHKSSLYEEFLEACRSTGNFSSIFF